MVGMADPEAKKGPLEGAVEKKQGLIEDGDADAAGVDALETPRKSGGGRKGKRKA